MLLKNTSVCPSLSKSGDHRSNEAGFRIVGGSHVPEIPIVSILGLNEHAVYSVPVSVGDIYQSVPIEVCQSDTATVFTPIFHPGLPGHVPESSITLVLE